MTIPNPVQELLKELDMCELTDSKDKFICKRAARIIRSLYDNIKDTKSSLDS